MVEIFVKFRWWLFIKVKMIVIVELISNVGIVGIFF